MSIFAEFELPSSAFALSDTFAELPDVVIEVERVIATAEILTPYFWVSDVSDEEFNAAVAADPSIRHLQRIDTFEEATLYRAEWTENIESIVYAYTQVGAVLLDATGYQGEWEMQMRFDDHSQLGKFREYCAENDIEFRVAHLSEISRSQTGQQYGLTEKQHKALVTACKAGYFQSPAETNLSEIAADLGISQQALSERLRNGQDALITNALLTDPPAP